MRSEIAQLQRRLGVTTRKSSPDLMIVVHMLSPDDSFDQLYISGYARGRVRDVLLRQEGVGDITIFGARQSSLRVWLDPDKLAAYGIDPAEVAGIGFDATCSLVVLGQGGQPLTVSASGDPANSTCPP